jgi:hypothetical protein
MATNWEKFYPYVQPYVPGCPEVVIDTHLQEAAEEFCARSEVWRAELETIKVVKSSADYELDTPAGALVENVLFLYLDGKLLSQVHDGNFIAPLTSTGEPLTGRPSMFSIFGDTSVRLYPTPDVKYTITGLVALKPSLRSSGVEDFIFNTHGRSIATGAVARLTGIPGKEWTNPDVSYGHMSEFQRKICAAKARDPRRSVLRVASVNFAGQ